MHATPAPGGHFRRLVAPSALLVGAAVLIYVLALAWSGPALTWEAARRLGWPGLLAGTAVASLTYGVRFLRWHFMLRILAHRIPWALNLRVYLSGLGLTSSPGKLGETVRSVFLLPHGVRLPDSLAAFFADRLSDVIGVALLGALAAAGSGQRLPLLEALAAAVLLLSFALRAGVTDPRWAGWVARLGRWGRVWRWLSAASFPALPWASLWAPRQVPVYVAAAVLAYGVQALVFAHFVAIVALPLPVLQCVAIFASATLIGAGSMVPAGLGVMEAALVLQLTLAGATPDAAIAVALLTRLATLWFGLLLGALALLSLARAPRATAGRE